MWRNTAALAIIAAGARALSSSSSAAKVKVLALHGKGGSGAAMARNIAPLVEATDGEWEFTFADAPHTLQALTAAGEAKALPPGFMASTGTAWWKLPPGVRSFEAEEFEGVEESLATLEQAWKDGPFDAVIGHSQGAMLAAIVVGKALTEESFDVRPRCAIINGAAWPNPFGELFLSLSDTVEDSTSTIPTLHCWGTDDTMNPPELAQKLKGCFPDSARLEHHGGHVVPMDPDSIAVMRAFVAEATRHAEAI